MDPAHIRALSEAIREIIWMTPPYLALMLFLYFFKVLTMNRLLPVVIAWMYGENSDRELVMGKTKIFLDKLNALFSMARIVVIFYLVMAIAPMVMDVFLRFFGWGLV